MALLMKPEPFSTEFDRLFNTLFDRSASEARSWTQPMDLVEAEDHFLLRADLPGMREEDVNIEVRHNPLRVSGERRPEHEQRARRWCRLESQSGKFSPAVTLAAGITP